MRTNSSSNYFDDLGNQEQWGRAYSHGMTEVFHARLVNSQRGENEPFPEWSEHAQGAPLLSHSLLP